MGIVPNAKFHFRDLSGQSRGCPHTGEVSDVSPSSTRGCEECLAQGDGWVHLRMCMICGSVGCCDSSKNKHASAHARRDGHPIARSIEPGEAWMWCFVDEIMVGEVEEG